MDEFLRASLEKERQNFIKMFPPGTEVWSNEFRLDYGTTVGGKNVYVETTRLVLVKNINGNPRAWGIWNIADVIKK